MENTNIEEANVEVNTIQKEAQEGVLTTPLNPTKTTLIELKDEEVPKQEVKKEQPITQIIHKDAVFELSLSDFSVMQQALAPLVWCNTLLNVAKDKTMAKPGNLVPVYEQDGIWNRNEKGEITGLKDFKDAEAFWKKNEKLKGNAMKVEKGELKTN